MADQIVAQAGTRTIFDKWADEGAAERAARAPTMSTNESAWWAAAARADGPFSRLVGPMSIGICGSLPALVQKHAIDVSGLKKGDSSKIYETTDAQGHTWYCRWLGDPFWSAFRDRTPDEVAEEIERCEDMLLLHVRKSQLRAARAVSFALQELAEDLRPERVASRRDRRALKRRLLGLAKFQADLLFCKMKGQDVRERCKALNVWVPSLDYQKWLDTSYH